MCIRDRFNMGYFFYYPMILLVVVWYFLYRFELFEKVSFVIVTAFFIYYLFYIFVPVAGPQFYFPAIGNDNVAQEYSLPSAIISIIIRNYCPGRDTSMDFSTIWWRVRNKWESVRRRLSPVPMSVCPLF